VIYVSCSTQTTDVNMTDVMLRPSAVLCTCPTYTCDWDVYASICRQWHQQVEHQPCQWGRCCVYRQWHPLRASFPFFYLTHQLANYQLALTGQLSLDAFPDEILTDSQLTER